MSVLAEPQNVTFASNLLRLPFIAEERGGKVSTDLHGRRPFQQGAARDYNKSIATSAVVLYRACAGCTAAASDESSAE